MASRDDVQKLASLARIAVDTAELETFSAEFESILAYIGQIESLKIDARTTPTPVVRNVFREDGEPHASGIYTEKLAEQFSARNGNSLEVKKIITHD